MSKRRVERGTAEVWRTIAANDARGVVELLLSQLCDFVQLLCTREEVIGGDGVLQSLGLDQRSLG